MIHDHDHSHEAPTVEHRTRALETLLVQKGLLTSEDIDKYLYRIEHDIGPMFGARVIARAWTDPAFKSRLLKDAPSAIAELDIDIRDTPLIVIESGPGIHHVVCCTLCSCYPWKLLGLPPTWYKSPAYRSRIVIDPRAVLQEFGTSVPDTTEIRVWDSTSECRYMVLPERPEGTDGVSEQELAQLVTRDSMVGVTKVRAPAGVA